MITLRIRWVEFVVYIAQMRKVYKVLVKKPEGKKPLEPPMTTVGMIRILWK
jgi:hypothetical protein